MALAVLVLAVSGAGAQAAQLRIGATVHGPLVRLSDLFSDLAPGQDCVLGPAPSPGAQLSIGNAQLVAIAEQFGVDWVSNSDTIGLSLSRPGQTIEKGALAALLAAELRDHGTQIDADTTIALDAVPSAEIDVGADLSVVALKTRSDDRRFDATLVVSVNGAETGRYGVSGALERLTWVAVPLHEIASGETIAATDLVMKQVASTAADGAARDTGEVEGLVSAEMLRAGVPIGRGKLRRATLIAKNASILMRLRAGGIEVTAVGQAIEAGAYGDRIRVINQSSHAVLTAAVTGPGEVAIEPGTPILIMGAQGSPIGRTAMTPAIRQAAWP